MQLTPSFPAYHNAFIKTDYILEFISQQLACKFRFKSGKIIYGIILECYDDEKRQTEYFFTTVAESKTNKNRFNNIQYCRQYAQPVNLEEIVHAEMLRLAA